MTNHHAQAQDPQGTAAPARYAPGTSGAAEVVSFHADLIDNVRFFMGADVIFWRKSAQEAADDGDTANLCYFLGRADSAEKAFYRLQNLTSGRARLPSWSRPKCPGIGGCEGRDLT